MVSISSANRLLHEGVLTSIPKVWCDCDGVLANFHKTFAELYNLSAESEVDVFLSKTNVWHHVAQKTPQLFAQLEPLPDAGKLITGLANLRKAGIIRLGILTALPDPWLHGADAHMAAGAADDKIKWITSHFPQIKSSDIVICARREKPEYGIADKLLSSAKPILIDDYKKNVVEWIERTRGYAIQHKSAEATLADLRVHLRGVYLKND